MTPSNGALALVLALVAGVATPPQTALTPIQAAPALPATRGAARAPLAAGRLACDGPGVPAWVTEQRERTLSYDGVARFAVRRYGPPVACDGAVTTEFDGVPYGRIVLTFADGVEYEVETMPIETSVSVLRAPAGFDDAATVEDALRTAAADIGLEIDWSSPEEAIAGGLTTHTFWDAQSGLNASVSLVYRDGILVEARISTAP